MRKVIKIVSILLVLVAVFVFYIFSTTGFFRTIENKNNEKVVKKISIPGVEDLTVVEENDFAIFISYDRASERDGTPKQGGIYMMNFKDGDFATKLLTSNHKRKLSPHGISLIRMDSVRHRLFVINHADGESIEVYDLFHKDSLIHYKTIRNQLIYAPNDIVAISENKFYVTNDHYYSSTIGRLAEDYLGLTKCETVYFDGIEHRVVDNDIAYANGINFDSRRNLIYIASPRGFKINVYNRVENGDLNYIESIDCGTGVDNIELDSNGNLWVGCHPSLLAFSSYAKGNKEFAPSEIIKIDYKKKGDYTVESVYVDDGQYMSASTVAGVYNNLMILGNVMDYHFLVVKK